MSEIARRMGVVDHEAADHERLMAEYHRDQARRRAEQAARDAKLKELAIR